MDESNNTPSATSLKQILYEKRKKLSDGAALSNDHFHDANVGKNLKMIPVAVENSPKTPFPGWWICE